MLPNGLQLLFNGDDGSRVELQSLHIHGAVYDIAGPRGDDRHSVYDHRKSGVCDTSKVAVGGLEHVRDEPDRAGTDDRAH